jgi:hypothetical protein
MAALAKGDGQQKRLNMIRIFALATTWLTIAAHSAYGQPPASADSSASNEVTAVSIKSGKLALSSTANPGPVFLADGAYANEQNTVIVVLHGRIVRIEYASGTVTQVASIRMQKERVMLTPPVVALMAVSPFPLPSGMFRSQDGVSSLRVVGGSPTAFTVPPRSPRDEPPPIERAPAPR